MVKVKNYEEFKKTLGKELLKGLSEGQPLIDAVAMSILYYVRHRPDYFSKWFAKDPIEVAKYIENVLETEKPNSFIDLARATQYYYFLDKIKKYLEKFLKEQGIEYKEEEIKKLVKA